MSFLQPWTAGPNKNYTNNFAYSIGTKVRFAWSIDFSNPELQLWQNNHPGDRQGGPNAIVEASIESSVYTWIVSYEGLNPSFNHVYYFQLQQAENVAVSHYFNITDKADGSPTSAISQATRSSTIANGVPSSSRTETQPGVTATITDHTTADRRPLTSGAIVGIAVACVVLITIVGGLWWWGRRRRRQRNSGEGHTNVEKISSNPSVQHNKQYLGLNTSSEADGHQIHEAPGMERQVNMYELDGGPSRI